MTDDELTRVVELVGVLWPWSEISDRVVAGYRFLLGGRDYDEVVAVLTHEATVRHREFPPPPGLVQWETRMAAARRLSGELAEDERERVAAAIAAAEAAAEGPRPANYVGVISRVPSGSGGEPEESSDGDERPAGRRGG